MRAYEFSSIILIEEKVRKVIGNSTTGLIKLDYDLDPNTKLYSGKFSIAYVNVSIANFYSLREGRLIGIDNTNDYGKIELHCHVLGKYLSAPALNKYTYPEILDVFYGLVLAITRKYKQDAYDKIDNPRF